MHVLLFKTKFPVINIWRFCFAMIQRADIEGSKSNVAMNSWQSQGQLHLSRKH